MRIVTLCPLRQQWGVPLGPLLPWALLPSSQGVAYLTKRSPKYRVSTRLTSTQIALMWRYLYLCPSPVSRVAKFLRIGDKKLLEFLNTKHGKSFFSTYRQDGDRYRWVRVNPFNLIERKAHFKPISKERQRCITRTMAVDGYGSYNKNKRMFIPSNRIYKRNQIDFINYKNRVSKLSLLFLKDPKKPENIYAPPVIRPYSTRFTDKKKQNAALAIFYSFWEKAALTEDKAIFFTLTTDPKIFNNLWEANKHIMESFNTLMSFLKKRIKAEIKRYPEFKSMFNDVFKNGVQIDQNYLFERRRIRMRLLHQQYVRDHPEIKYPQFCEMVTYGEITKKDLGKLISTGYEISSHYKDLKQDFKVKYLNVLEFQENGRLHLHVIFYGLDYLVSINELNRKWYEYGQGQYTTIFSLKKDPKDPLKWTWKNPKSRPKDHRNRSPVEYLKVYLSKAQYITAVNYWVFNSRYYTNSRNFDSEEEQFTKALERKLRRLKPKFYVYARSLDLHTNDFNNVPYVGLTEYEKYMKSILGASPPSVASCAC